MADPKNNVQGNNVQGNNVQGNSNSQAKPQATKVETSVETPMGTAGFEAKTAGAAADAGRTADVFAFPTFDANEVTDMYRQYADQATRQARDAYARMKDVAEDAQGTMENSFETVQNAGVTMGLKMIDAMRTNAELGLSHMESLLRAKSASEFVELNSTYARKQTETTMDQMKGIQETGTRVAEDMAAPVKEQMEKAARDLKVA